MLRSVSFDLIGSRGAMLRAPVERPPKNKREYLRRLVAAKQHWSEPLSAADNAEGFRGWHERGYLPHCDKPGLVQFVTFRLWNSMPASRCSEWKHLLAIEDESEKRRKLEEYLDRGVGDCLLRDARFAAIVEKAMLFHHGQRFDLLAWVVMPNHVHALIKIERIPLSRVMQNWKSITAIEANKVGGANGRFWQPDYWDTYMRDEEQTRKAIRYIENNPVKAALCRAAEEWPFSSARFRDEKTRALVLPKA